MSNERPRYPYPAPLLKIVFVHLLPAEVGDLSHRKNEAKQKLTKKPYKKSEKSRNSTFDVSKVTSGGNMKHAEANCIFTASALTNRTNFVKY
jgi:hypothetical protein